MRARLEEPYRKTEYRIQVGSTLLDFRIGRRQAHADEVLIKKIAGDYRHWAIITPCNPGSVALCEYENLARLEDFRRALTAQGYRWLPSVSLDPAEHWPEEPGALILDIPLNEAMALGRRFGQIAIVYGLQGAAAQLLWLDP